MWMETQLRTRSGPVRYHGTPSTRNQSGSPPWRVPTGDRSLLTRDVRVSSPRSVCICPTWLCVSSWASLSHCLQLTVSWTCSLGLAWHCTEWLWRVFPATRSCVYLHITAVPCCGVSDDAEAGWSFSPWTRSFIASCTAGTSPLPPIVQKQAQNIQVMS